MGKPIAHEQPDVKRYSTRAIKIPPLKRDLEFQLVAWVKEVVDYIGQNAPMEGGLKPENYLVATADGIDLMMYAPTPMASSNGSVARTVYATFVWGRRSYGNWYIRHVKFGLNLSRAELTEAEKRELKDRLTDQAETRNMLQFHRREAVFPAEQYVGSWHNEIAIGNRHVDALIDHMYEYGKKEASMPENPYTPQDIALGLVGGGVKRAKDATERTKKLAEAYEKAEKAKSLSERGEKMRESMEKKEKNPVYEKSTNDVLAEGVIDQGSDLAGNLVPGAGGVVKLFAGMFFDMFSANFAKEVTRIRARVYSCFVAGFITGIALYGSSELKNERDKIYYQKGLDKARMLDKATSFRYQIALLDYSREYIVNGFWAGTTYEYHGLKKPVWNFPDDYVTQWSPQLLGRALITKIGYKKYVLD